MPLVALPQSTQPVSNLLETWNSQYGRLLDQASSSQPPQGFLATNPNVVHHRPGNIILNTPKEHINQVLYQDHSVDTIICGMIGSKTTNNCSQRHLLALWQECVRLAVSPSWGKDIFSQVCHLKDIYMIPRPSLIGDRIPHDPIPAEAHSVAL